jgi:hypothetical protein
VTPAIFSPNGDGRLDRLTVEFSLTAPAEARVRILRRTSLVATPLDATAQAGPQKLVWDGATASGTVSDGNYLAAVDAVTEAGTATVIIPFAVDTLAPRVRIVSLRPLEISVSEPARLMLIVDGAWLQREVRRAATIRIRRPQKPRRIRVVAVDRAGNTSAPVVVRARPSP